MFEQKNYFGRYSFFKEGKEHFLTYFNNGAFFYKKKKKSILRHSFLSPWFSDLLILFRSHEIFKLNSFLQLLLYEISSHQT